MARVDIGGLEVSEYDQVVAKAALLGWEQFLPKTMPKILDIGAHAGGAGLRLLKQGRVGAAVLIEGNMSNYLALLKNVALNDLSATALPIFAMLKPERKNACVYVRCAGNSGQSSDLLKGIESTEPSPVILPWEIPGLGNCKGSLLKMDIEGGEYELFEAPGFCLLLQEFEWFACELHSTTSGFHDPKAVAAGQIPNEDKMPWAQDQIKAMGFEQVWTSGDGNHSFLFRKKA